MPAVPSRILDPTRDQCLALLPERQDRHPWGRHNPRISDQVVFDRLLQVLVFGRGYKRVADHLCSATTLRRRRDERIAAGVMETLRLLVLACYDRAYRSSPTQRRPPPATTRYCPPLSTNSPIWKLLWGRCPSIRG